MAIINRRINLAAGETNANVLQGSIFEFLRADSRISVGVVSEFGTPAGAVTLKFVVGDAIVADGGTPAKVEQALGRGVNIDSDLNMVDVGRAMERLSLEIVNGDVAARDVEYYVLVE